MAVSYGLRALGLRAEFYKLAAKDSTYAKLVLPAVEKREDLAAAYILEKPMNYLETHMTTQLMKAVASLSGSDTDKKAGRPGGGADNN